MSVKYDDKRCREFVLRKTLIFCKHISKQYLSETHTMPMQENKSCILVQSQGQFYRQNSCHGNFHHKKETIGQRKFALLKSPRTTKLKKWEVSAEAQAYRFCILCLFEMIGIHIWKVWEGLVIISVKTTELPCQFSHGSHRTISSIKEIPFWFNHGLNSTINWKYNTISIPM